MFRLSHTHTNLFEIILFLRLHAKMEVDSEM